MQKRREKQKIKEERREAKKETASPEIPDDPMLDPTIDWGSAVREGQNLVVQDEDEGEEETEEGAAADA